MDQNYWANILNSPMGSEVVSRGMEALQTGKVTEADAAKNLSPLLKAAGFGKKNPLLNPKRAPSLPSVAAGSGLTNTVQEGAKAEDLAKTDNKTVQQNLLTMSPEQLNSIYTSTEALPTFQEQKAGIGRMQDLLNISSEAKPDVFSGPIAGLLQSQFGMNTSGMAAQAARQESPQQQRNNLLSMTGKIQDDRRDLSKSIFDAIGKQKAGFTTQTLAEQLLNRNIIDSIGKTEAKDPNAFKKGGAKVYDPRVDLEKHQKRMEGLQGALSTYGDLDTLLGGVENYKGEDIPGVGLTARAPSFMLSKKGSDIQQTFADLKNQLIYMRSGKQINEQEFRRLSTALGSGITGGDREFVNAIKRYGSELKDVMKQKESAVKGLHPEVLKLYKEGGGTLSDDFTPPGERKVKAAPAKGGKKLDDMTNEELKAYLAAGSKK